MISLPEAELKVCTLHTAIQYTSACLQLSHMTHVTTPTYIAIQPHPPRQYGIIATADYIHVWRHLENVSASIF